MKKVFGEFKKFIARGNVLDLAVGIIVGGAFTAIVTALTNNIIRPLVNYLIALIGGKDSLSQVFTFLSRSYNSDGTIDLANSIYIDWGAFVTAIIDFLIIATTIFVIVKVVNASRERIEKINSFLELETQKERKAERKAIRKKAKEEKRKFKDVWKEYADEKQAEMDAKAKLEAEEKLKKEAEERLKNPTDNDLLKEIRDLLVENKTKNKAKLK